MKIIVIGAAGTIGSAVSGMLAPRHDLVRVGRKSGDAHADLRDPASLAALYAAQAPFDAVVVAAGTVHWAPLAEMDREKYLVGVHDKLLGQVDAVLQALPHIRDGGSFTLTSGLLSHDPVRAGSAASMVNGAIDAFVRAASIELGRGLRINAVSPGLVDASVDAFGPFFPGQEPVPLARVARAYVKSVEGFRSGQVFRVE